MDKKQAYTFFKQSIEYFYPMPEESVKRLFAICSLHLIKKGQNFVTADEVPEYMGFNLNGIFRLFYIKKDGNEFIKGFSTPGNFVVSYSAMIQNRPSYFHIEAVEDTMILKFSFAHFMRVMDEDIRWYKYLYKVVQSIYIIKEMREKSFLIDDAASRYQKFRQEYPGLEQKIKAYHVASFLGITPEALCRIKKKLNLLLTN